MLLRWPGISLKRHKTTENRCNSLETEYSTNRQPRRGSHGQAYAPDSKTMAPDIAIHHASHKRWLPIGNEGFSRHHRTVCATPSPPSLHSRKAHITGRFTFSLMQQPCQVPQPAFAKGQNRRWSSRRHQRLESHATCCRSYADVASVWRTKIVAKLVEVGRTE